LGALGVALFRHVFEKPVLVLAVLGPVLIDVFLYASFKSLDFGLLLLMIPAVILEYKKQPESEKVRAMQ